MPTTTKDYAYNSSGTWSLVGLEVPAPIINDAALAATLIANDAREVAGYMLFVDEAPLTPVEMTATAKAFSAQGPRDGKGRGLYQLDLKTRLLAYPCSYMIYSEAFDALPPPGMRGHHGQGMGPGGMGPKGMGARHRG